MILLSLCCLCHCLVNAQKSTGTLAELYEKNTQSSDPWEMILASANTTHWNLEKCGEMLMMKICVSKIAVVEAYVQVW